MNNENMDINIDGIKVNKEKKVIYLKFETLILELILIFNEFLISKNMIIKKNISKIIFAINSNWRLNSFNFIKLLSMNVKKVKMPIDKVNIKINIINMFFLIKLIIIYE